MPGHPRTEPSKKIKDGPSVLRPVICATLEAPDMSDLQSCTDQEIANAYTALAWIDSVINGPEERSRLAAEQTH
jgi:hypothetical protein